MTKTDKAYFRLHNALHTLETELVSKMKPTKTFEQLIEEFKKSTEE